MSQVGWHLLSGCCFITRLGVTTHDGSGCRCWFTAAWHQVMIGQVTTSYRYGALMGHINAGYGAAGIGRVKVAARYQYRLTFCHHTLSSAAIILAPYCSRQQIGRRVEPPCPVILHAGRRFTPLPTLLRAPSAFTITRCRWRVCHATLRC